MSQFWWIRHGPTHEKNVTGWRDVPADLSDTGAIARLSAYLPEDALLVSSDLTRAITTADALSHPTRQRLPHERDLREFNFGTWDGLGFQEVAALDPDLSRAFWENPGDIAPPEGESWNALRDRAAKLVRELTTEHEHVILVAHFGTILTQLGHARAEPPYKTLAQKIDPLALTRLELKNGAWITHEVNHRP